MNRVVQLGPVVFALIGAGAGICASMLLHTEPPFQVHFEASVPPALLGAVAGAAVGCVVSARYSHSPRLTRRAGLLSFALLGAPIVAPLGWIAGTITANERLPSADVKEQVQHLPPVGLALGAAAGCVMGLALGAVQLRWDRRRATSS
jgi:hypothetical protein